MAVAKGLSIYGNGVNLATAFKEYNPTADREVLDATALNDTAKVFEMSFKNGTISVNAVWKHDEVNLDEIDNIIGAAYENDTNIVLTASKLALAVGGSAELSDVFVTKYSKPAQYGQLIMLSADFQATGGINFGVWLFSDSVNDTTETGATVDNGAATANGGILHYHAQNVDLASLTDATIDLEHSVDGSTWVVLVNDLMSDGVADNEAMSYTVPAGTTVRRYLRVVATTTGGTANIQAAFARR